MPAAAAACADALDAQPGAHHFRSSRIVPPPMILVAALRVERPVTGRAPETTSTASTLHVGRIFAALLLRARLAIDALHAERDGLVGHVHAVHHVVVVINDDWLTPNEQYGLVGHVHAVHRVVVVITGACMPSSSDASPKLSSFLRAGGPPCSVDPPTPLGSSWDSSRGTGLSLSVLLAS